MKLHVVQVNSQNMNASSLGHFINHDPGRGGNKWAASWQKNKLTVRPAKTQISLGIRPVCSESSLSAWRKLGSLATHWAHSKDWSDWADAQVDLSLRWAHNHFVGFVMRRLNCRTNIPVISDQRKIVRSLRLRFVKATKFGITDYCFYILMIYLA